MIYILIFIAIFFRLIFSENFGVGFDQVQILQNANQIIYGDFSLIGPRTGPINMFTGPLIYYLSVPFVYFLGNFKAIVLVPLFISIITGTIFYLLMKKYSGEREALIAVIIWAFSPFLVSLDRVFWNPNLIFLSSILILIPLFYKKIDKVSFISLFLGSFLSYQAHFSGLPLIFLAICLIIFLKKSKKLLLPILTGLFLSLLPTFIFDLRNNFLNLKGLMELFSSKNDFNLFAMIKDILHNLYILIETFGKLFFFGNSTQTIVAFGLLLIIIGLFFYKKNLQIKSFLIWLFAVAVIYSFYCGSKPEYYFLIVIPVLIFTSIEFFKKLKEKYLYIILFFFMLNSTLINLKLAKNDHEMSVGNIEKIKNLLLAKNVSQIIYDVPYGSEIGIKYLLSDLNMVENGELIHISYPHNLKHSYITNIGDIAVWSDRRTESKNYVSSDDYILETNLEYSLFKNLYLSNSKQKIDVYEIVKNNNLLGQLSVVHEENNEIDWVKACLDAEGQDADSWNYLSKENFYFYREGSYCLGLAINNVSLMEIDAIGVNIL